MKKLVICGAGGFGTEVLYCLRDINKTNEEWDILGFIDEDPDLQGKIIRGAKVLGGNQVVLDMEEEVFVVIAIGSSKTRKKVFDKFHDKENIKFPNIIHPNASVYTELCDLGIGNIVFIFSGISNNVKMGDFNVLNSFSNIGHDTEVGSHNTFHPKVAISGGVKVGNLNEFGVGCSVLPYKSIGSNNVIGAHSLLLRNVGDDKLYFGSPAKRVDL